jgi:hypothetical protein
MHIDFYTAKIIVVSCGRKIDEKWLMIEVNV